MMRILILIMLDFVFTVFVLYFMEKKKKFRCRSSLKSAISASSLLLTSMCLQSACNRRIADEPNAVCNNENNAEAYHYYRMIKVIANHCLLIVISLV